MHYRPMRHNPCGLLLVSCIIACMLVCVHMQRLYNHAMYEYLQTKPHNVLAIRHLTDQEVTVFLDATRTHPQSNIRL
jgi:hypothetical protein